MYSSVSFLRERERERARERLPCFLFLSSPRAGTMEIFCMEEWSKIPPNLFSNLIKHFRKMLSAVIFAR